MRLSPIFEQQVLAEMGGEFPRSEILSHVREHKVVFLYLLSQQYERGYAYRRLRGCINEGLDPRTLIRQPSGTGSDVARPFFGISHGAVAIPEGEGIPLPDWFKKELALHLGGAAFWAGTEAANLSYWLAARLLTDGRFQASMNLARRRWHIHGDPLTWYQAMNQEQDKVIAKCSEEGIGTHYDHLGKLVPSRPLGWHVRVKGNDLTATEESGLPKLEIGMPHLECWDFRDVGTYRDLESPFGIQLGFPIEDFERDLGALAWLAGGAPDSYEWRHWIEVSLWDFAELPMLSSQEGIEHWQETGRNQSLNSVGYASVEQTPQGFRRTEPGRVRFHPNLFAITGSGAAGIRFLSRWIRIGRYPDEYHPHLVRAIIQQWGDYEDPPDKANMRRVLQALLRPADVQSARAKVDEELDENADNFALGRADLTETAAARQRASRRFKRRLTP